MAVPNRRKIIQQMGDPYLPFYQVRSDPEYAQPGDVDPAGNIYVHPVDASGATVGGLTPNMNAQAATAANVTAADGEKVAANPDRRSLVLVNDSDTAIYLGFDGHPAVINAGIRLNATGGNITLSRWGPVFTEGAVNAIHAGVGNKVLTIQEFQ